MKQYRLGDPPAGEPQGPAAPLQGQVSLLSPQEFAGWAAELPQGEKLVRSLQSAAYCQVENFLGSTQGIIRTPRRQMAFGFYLRPEYLLLVPVAGQLQPVLEQLHPAVPAAPAGTAAGQRPAPFPAAVGTVFRPGGVAAAPGGAAALPADHRLPQAAQRLPRLL